MAKQTQRRHGEDALKSLHKIADNVPTLLARADDHNALSTPRLLADGASEWGRGRVRFLD